MSQGYGTDIADGNMDLTASLLSSSFPGQKGTRITGMNANLPINGAGVVVLGLMLDAVLLESTR